MNNQNIIIYLFVTGGRATPGDMQSPPQILCKATRTETLDLCQRNFV